MKRIILSLAIIAAVGAIAVGATTAYFSDNETSTGNTFTAGTLDLNLDGANINVVKFTVDNVKPGDTGSGIWVINNVGTIDGFVDLESISQVNDDNGCNEPETEDGDTTCGAGQGDLGVNLNIDLFVDADNNGIKGAGEATIYNGAVSGLAANYEQNLSLGASETNYVTLNWAVPTTAGNEIQSDSLVLNLTFELAQTTGQ